MRTAEMVLAVAHLVVMCGVWVELGKIRRSCNRGVIRTEFVADRLMVVRGYRTLFWD
jgi:hypothetical protein